MGDVRSVIIDKVRPGIRRIRQIKLLDLIHIRERAARDGVSEVIVKRRRVAVKKDTVGDQNGFVLCAARDAFNHLAAKMLELAIDELLESVEWFRAAV